MKERKNIDTNKFEGKVKITGFTSKDLIIEKINSFLEKYKENEKDKLYDIEKETPSSILLNFHNDTEMANLIITKLKLLKMENKYYSQLNCQLIIHVVNPKKDEKNKKEEKNEKNEEKAETERVKKYKKINSYIYNIDTKNNPRMNKLLGKSMNFNRRNINQYLSPNNNKMKIYESIFLSGGPYIERNEIAHEEVRKNKAKWINKKGFNPYISKDTILKNAHMIENYLHMEPHQSNVYNFRQVQKPKWVGKNNFYI